MFIDYYPVILFLSFKKCLHNLKGICYYEKLKQLSLVEKWLNYSLIIQCNSIQQLKWKKKSALHSKP